MLYCVNTFVAPVKFCPWDGCGKDNEKVSKQPGSSDSNGHKGRE